MADLEFNIKASFEEVAKARQELERLRQELKNTTKATDPIVVQDLTDKYDDQRRKVRELTSAMSRYATVTSSDFTKKMQSLTRECYNFELQADASKRKIEKLSSEIGKMQSKLRQGGLDAGTSTVYQRDVTEKSTILDDEKRRYENLTGLGKQARQELQNMQAEYVKYSGSSTATTDNVKVMTDAFANMIDEMKKVPTVGEGATSLFNRLGGDAKTLAMSLMGGLGFEQLAQHVFNVRSEFQQLEISFTTMLGSEQKAGALMDQLINTAAKTPFDMSSITNGAKQLLAYGTAANEVNDILVHLGDISAGLNVPLGDLVYLYGTTMAQGRMYTMDLRQFMGRGIPMAEELGKLMGKTTQEVQEAVSKGQVGADLVKKAIEGMTAEGGKFGGLMEKQSATLQGKWSNIGDTVDQMFNEIGKKSEGVFGTGLDLISSLVDNWENVVKVIGTAVVAVGTYKAGLMAAASIQKIQNQNTLDSITKTIDNQIEVYKAQAEIYKAQQGKNTDGYKQGKVAELTDVVSNTDMIGNKNVEELVSLKIKEAQTNGLITQQMAEQLQLKRDMLVAQQQTTANEQLGSVELSKGIDDKLAQYKEMESDYRHLNGKDTEEYKTKRYDEIGSALTDVDRSGDEVEAILKEAQAEGLISEEMSKQLQLKHELLVEQSKIAEKEQLQYENALNAKEAAEEEARAKKAQEAEIEAANIAAAQAKAESDLKEKIAKANETAYGKALLETNTLQKKVDLQQESYDKAMDEASEKRIVLAQLDEQIKKQQQILDQKEKEIVYDEGSVDTTSFGGYEDGYSQNENNAIAEYEAERAKLEELMQKCQQASDEFESANARRKTIQEELTETSERLADAQENEIEIYKQTGAEADEIGEIVQQGIDIEEGKISITDAASASTQANTTSESANSAAKNANANATAIETTTNAANTTSEVTNTAATNTNTTSENVNTGAKQRNTLVTGLMSVGTKAATLAQAAFTWATNTLTTSLKGLWAAMLANPLTTVITLVSTAISVFSMFGSEEEDAGQKTQDMGNKAAEASNKVRSLFALLNTGSAEDHKDTINELKSAYEEYGIKLDETKMKSKSMVEQADELKAHEEELIGIIEKRSVEMERANQLQQAYDNFGSSNDAAFADFKEAMDGKLSNVEMGTIRSMISQDDLDKLAELRKEMSECGDDLSVYNALNAEYAKIQGEVNVKLGTYLENMGYNRSEVAGMIPDINSYTDTLVNNTVALKDGVDEANNSADAAERARKATSKLTYAQEEQALKNQFAKKTFKELNSDIQQTIKLCSKKIGLDIKVNYDDSELPAWIKKMSNSQLKASMAARKDWLDKHRGQKDAVALIGGQYKTYAQVMTELAMMQARGTNVENKPQKTQKELDKEKKAREKAAKAAEKARNDAETKAGNRKKAEEDYVKTVSAYVEKAEETMSKNRIAAMKDGYEKEVAQINENAEKERKAVEDGIDKLVEARKKKDQTVWVNSGKNRKANMWKQEKSDEEYRKEVLGESMRDDNGNEVKNEAGKVMTIGESVQKQKEAIDKKAADDIAKAKEERELNERASVQSYYKEYGDSNQKRSALTEEAEDKIKKISEDKSATDKDKEYQKKSVQEGLKKSLASLDFEDLKKEINWDFVFGDLDSASASTLEVVKNQLKEFVETAKGLEPDQIKTVVDAMTQIQDKMDLTNPIKSIRDARSEYTALSKEYAKYKKDYDDASASGNEDAKKIALGKMTQTEQKMVKAKSKEKKSYSEVTNVVGQYAQALNEAGDTMGGTTGECIKLAASAISCGSSMASGINQFGEAASNLEKSVAILAIIEAALKAIQLITQLFGDTADETLTDYVETLDTYINLLDDSISDLNDSMSDTKNTMKDTIAYYEELVKLEKDSATAIKSQSQTWLNSGASKGFMGISSSSSEGVKIRKQIEKDLKSSNAEVKKFYTEGYKALNEYYKKVKGKYASSASDFGRMDFLWELSDEDLLKLAEDTKALSLLGDTLSSAITNYASKLKQIKDDDDSLAESLLDVSFDDFYDDFASVIKEMDNTSADFAQNFSEYMRNALVKNLVAEQYKGKLETLYKKAAAWAKEGVLTSHIEELRQEYEDYAAAAKKDVETIDDITGYDASYSQSASSGAFESMSQDTGEELNGRFTAVQIATEGTYQVAQEIDRKLGVMLGLSDGDGVKDEGVTKIDAPTTVASSAPAKTSVDSKTVEMLDDVRDGFLDFAGSSENMLTEVNAYRKVSGKHSLEYATGMSTDDLVAYIEKNRILNDDTLPNDTSTSILSPTTKEDNESFLSANISSITANVGNMWLAVDEGRTILAQSLMCLQSMDERQESWHKPMLQAFSDIHELKDKMSRL